MRQRMEDLRTTNDSLMGDKKRLEAEVQRLLDQIAGMQAAVASYEEMKAERDIALAKIEEERRTGLESQKQAVEATKVAMQDQINTVNGQLHEAVVAQAAAQAEANSLREFKAANDHLHEVVGEQKAKLGMLEEQVGSLVVQKERSEAEAIDLREKNRKQETEIQKLKSQIRDLRGNTGADEQTTIDGV